MGDSRDPNNGKIEQLSNDPQPVSGSNSKSTRKAARPAAAAGTPGAATQTTNPAGIATPQDHLTTPALAVETVVSAVPPPYKNELPKTATQLLDNAQTSLIILTLLDGLASMVFGPKAAMTDAERTMLQEPLTRIMGRLNFTQGAALSQYMDPLLLCMGLIGWASRVAREKAAEKPKETPLQASQRTEEPPPPPNVRPPLDDGTYQAPASFKEAFQGGHMEIRS